MLPGKATKGQQASPASVQAQRTAQQHPALWLQARGRLPGQAAPQSSPLSRPLIRSALSARLAAQLALLCHCGALKALERLAVVLVQPAHLCWAPAEQLRALQQLAVRLRAALQARLLALI